MRETNSAAKQCVVPDAIFSALQTPGTVKLQNLHGTDSLLYHWAICGRQLPKRLPWRHDTWKRNSWPLRTFELQSGSSARTARREIHV